MRTWLSAAVAAVVLIFAMAGVASAAPGSNGNGNSKGKGSLPPIDMSNAANCDFIAEPGNALCLLPFPDDYYTRPDSSSPTGRRVDLNPAGMPENAAGVHIDATTYHASDGFSPGATILLKVPGIDTVADVRATGAVPINHIRQYRRANAPVVVIDTRTGRRWPIWLAPADDRVTWSCPNAAAWVVATPPLASTVMASAPARLTKVMLCRLRSVTGAPPFST